MITNWDEHTDSNGDQFWTLEYLDGFAAVVRFGQAWEGKVWPHGRDSDSDGLAGFYSSPAMAMASMLLAIEAGSVSA